MSFPIHRARRLRKTELLRGLVRETHLTVANLIYPMFVRAGSNIRQEVTSMPGVFQQSADKIVERRWAITMEVLPEINLPMAS